MLHLKRGIFMHEGDNSTQKRILEAAKTEFLEKGFRNASLRNIVKVAGVTTGAFYGYYSNKEALFSALVEPHAAAIMGNFVKTQDAFSQLPDAEQPSHMGMESGEYLSWLVDYVYDDPDHYTAMKLIICCSEGTPYQNFIHQMVEVEVDATYLFLDTLRRLGNQVPPIDRQLCHIVSSGMFSGMFEVVVHDMPKEQAKNYVTALRKFYQAGWRELMHVGE